MQQTSLAERIKQTIGPDSGGAVARRLALQGAAVSYQAVHKWLNGGNVADKNLEALARCYRVSLTWLKFGEGSGLAPLREIFDALPQEGKLQVLDFIVFQLSRPNSLCPGESLSKCVAHPPTTTAQRFSRGSSNASWSGQRHRSWQ